MLCQPVNNLSDKRLRYFMIQANEWPKNGALCVYQVSQHAGTLARVEEHALAAGICRSWFLLLLLTIPLFLSRFQNNDSQDSALPAFTIHDSAGCLLMGTTPCC